MEPLSGFDSFFISLEMPTMHMHVGSVNVLEGSLQYDDFRDLIASRVHLVPSFRQRLVTVPFGLGRPVWVDDPEYDLDLHLQHVALPAPGGWAELRHLAARIFSDPLDRGRPLWQLVFVEGVNAIPRVPPESVAVIAKVHHAAIDGVSGADIMGLLYDTTPELRQVPPPEPWQPDSIPTDFLMLVTSVGNLFALPARIPGLVKTTIRSVAGATYVNRVRHAALPTLPFQAPPTPINDVVSAQRVWHSVLISLDRVKAIKNRAGVTVNDVVLAICCAALRAYLLKKDALPDKPLVVAAPVSLRTEDGSSQRGNQVSTLFVQLPVNEADSAEMLLSIHSNTRKEKAYLAAVSANWLLEYSELVPFALANEAARLYTHYQTALHHRPFVNAVITNVPGPQIPLYLAGKRLLAVMGTAPVGDGISLIITVLSYDGTISISPTTGANIMPDIDQFVDMLRQATDELEAAVFERFPLPDEQEVAVSEAIVSDSAESDAQRCTVRMRSGDRCRNTVAPGLSRCYIHA
ncbi:MAG: wax ester/triacylglycerol synthase family O-acyltransferase [Anaerolineae bacterium]|nr:wax ester/triacylglycerol synthase family O-acyltransferase [Anaerolineae bacterium]